jgi:hypothetical protein
MEKAREYHTLTAVLLMFLSAVAGATARTAQASTKSLLASFDPQTRFPVGSSLTIRSVYGIATANPMHSNQPPDNRTLGSQTTQATFRPQNQTGDRPPFPRNETTQQSSQAYSTSLTISAQITGNENDSIQWTIQGGTIVINGTTYNISTGKGEMSKFDCLITNGTATGANGQTYVWHMEGLATLYGDTVIGELTGTVTASTNNDLNASDMDVSYIMTMT